MLAFLSTTLAQIKNLDSNTPRIPDPPSTATTWILIAILVVPILLITFKTARRNQNVIEE